MARIFLGIREQMEAELWLIGDGPEMGAVKSILVKAGMREMFDTGICRAMWQTCWLKRISC